MLLETILAAPNIGRTVRNLASTLAFVWLGCLGFALLQQLSGLLTLDAFVPTPLRSIVIITLYYWLPWVALAPIVAVCSARFPIRPNDWVRPIVAHVALMLSLSLLHGLVIGYIYHYSALRAPSMAGFA